MSEFGTLEVSVRHGQGKGFARKLRAQGLVPAVLYGPGGDNVTLALSPSAFSKATDPKRKWNTLYNLTIKEEGKPDRIQPTLLSDIQIDTVRRDVVHVDFFRVDPERPVTRKIPVVYSGRSIGVTKGGRMRTFFRTVKVEAKPLHIPVELDIDVTPVDEGQSIRVRDLNIEHVRVVERGDRPICTVEAKKAATEEETAADAKKK